MVLFITSIANQKYRFIFAWRFEITRMPTDKNPLISCVVPTFNRAGKVVRAVESILAQTYQNLEVLVVDDQSEDNTREVIRKLSEKDSRVKYFLNPEKGGNHARNFGIKNAAGEYIAFLDDDDTWLEHKLEKQVEVFLGQRPGLGVVYCTFARKSHSGKTNRRHPGRFSRVKNGDILKKLLRRNFITTSSILVRSEVFKKCGGFNPSYKSFQDWELLTRIACDYHFYHVNEVLVNQFESGDSITLDKKGRALTKYRHLKQFLGHYENSPRLLSNRYCSLGFTLFKLKRYGFARRFYKRSLKNYPFNLEALLFLLFIKIRDFFS